MAKAGAGREADPLVAAEEERGESEVDPAVAAEEERCEGGKEGLTAGVADEGSEVGNEGLGASS